MKSAVVAHSPLHPRSRWQELVEQQEQLSRLLLTLRLAARADEQRRAVAAGVQAHPTLDIETIGARTCAAVALDRFQ